MRWSFSPKPIDGELLGSYLVRGAGLYGVPPDRFCAFHFPEFRIWTRDIDRSATEPFLNALSEKAGLPPERVERMTLRDWGPLVSSRRHRGAASWINALGVYHRVRLRHGLQYCPMCIAGVPAYKKSWRLSFVTVCEMHRCMLLDACPCCGAPIIPHRQLAGALRCHSCHHSLVGASLPPPKQPESAAALQSECLHALGMGFADVGGARVQAGAYFRGLRILASVMSERGCGKGRGDAVSCRLPMECMGTASRVAALGALEALLAAWPQSFRRRAADRRWTRRTFCRHSVPAWLYREVRHLPHGRVRRAGTRHSLRAKLASLGRQKPDGWRGKRAALLICAAKERRL